MPPSHKQSNKLGQRACKQFLNIFRRVHSLLINDPLGRFRGFIFVGQSSEGAKVSLSRDIEDLVQVSVKMIAASWFNQSSIAGTWLSRCGRLKVPDSFLDGSSHGFMVEILHLGIPKISVSLKNQLLP